jgi:6-phosphogluconolactonase
LAKRFLFWVDERWVPLDDARSNKMAYDCLLSHVDIKNNIYPMYKEGVPAEDYALEYEKLLKLLRRMENLTLFY